MTVPEMQPNPLCVIVQLDVGSFAGDSVMMTAAKMSSAIMMPKIVFLYDILDHLVFKFFEDECPYEDDGDEDYCWLFDDEINEKKDDEW